jgi:chromosome segregation ATPase
MEETVPALVGIKDAAEMVGCSDKVIRNYIKDGKISSKLIDSPYGEQYLVDPEEVKTVYNSRRSSTLELKKFQSRPENSTQENPALKEIIPTLEGFRADYKEAMERISVMSYELGNAQKEVKLLTGDSLEKASLEKQIQALKEEAAELRVRNEYLQQRVDALETERKKSVWQRITGK